jgi:hypothetical protein
MFEGFLVGGHKIVQQNGAAHGKGIYTSRCVDDAIRYSQRGRAVVMCLALPGISSATEEMTSHSWKPRPDWHVFREADQLLPMCIVTY